MIHHGDCLEVLRTLPDNSVDAVVTDPPYGLSFMGKKWDYDVPSVEVWAECLRVLKPGGHLLAFAGTRTQHRMAVRIEDAGFEIRDMIAWVYGSGFPKSLDVSKAIDKAAGAEREVLGYTANARPNRVGKETKLSGAQTIGGEITAAATDAAKQWEGWGTALKPALEPITVARKPLCGTVAENVLKHGTGGINVDGCRVGTAADMNARDFDDSRRAAPKFSGKFNNGQTGQYRNRLGIVPNGRWPANLIHDGSDEVVGLFPSARSAGNYPSDATGRDGVTSFGGGQGQLYADTGSAARFFYCAKASKADRDEGCEGMPLKKAIVTTMQADQGMPMRMENGLATGPKAPPKIARNHHPTVKPTDLMRYLCRLVTPPGGVVLDPFAGSGSTGKAAKLEGFSFIGIEREAEYVAIARARIGMSDHSMPAALAPPEATPQLTMF